MDGIRGTATQGIVILSFPTMFSAGLGVCRALGPGLGLVGSSLAQGCDPSRNMQIDKISLSIVSIDRGEDPGGLNSIVVSEGSRIGCVLKEIWTIWMSPQFQTLCNSYQSIVGIACTQLKNDPGEES
eukprot:910032_1